MVEPTSGEIRNGKATIKNTSEFAQYVAGNDNIVDFVPMAEPDNLTPIQVEPSAGQPQDEPTFQDISLDPDGLLPQQVKAIFAKTNERFSQVFQSDLPQYNGCFGTVKASINLPRNLPPSSRLKHCPWYPKSKLLELQEKMDDLESKGVLAKPQDLDINVEAVSPSFLVAKRPANRGYRLVTSFGHLTSHVKSRIQRAQSRVLTRS